MRICLITSLPLPPEEGLGFHIWNLSQELIRRGHQVGVITRGTMAPTSMERLSNLTIWRVPFVPCYPFHVHLHSYFVNRLLRQIEHQFDIINEHTPLPPVINTHLPIVATVHSPMRADTDATVGFDFRMIALRLQTPVSQKIEMSIFRRSKKITTVASWVADALQSYGVPSEAVTITGNGVDHRFLDNSLSAKKEPIALYVGRLEKGKGLPDLINAAKILFTEMPEISLRFVIAGKGSLRPWYERLVSEAGLQKHFEFVGHLGAEQRDELIRLYRRASIFVLPSHHEGMSTVLLEAMACGLPVISTAVGGATEVIQDGKNGLLVAAHEPRELAEALLNMWSNEPLRLELGDKARMTVRQRYSWSAIGERYLACFDETMNQCR